MDYDNSVDGSPCSSVGLLLMYLFEEDNHMRANIILDDELVKEAFKLTQARTKKELIHLALQELIHNRKRKNLFDLAGKIELQEHYDYKSLRSVRYRSD